jgi:molecular chaperone GrpE
VSQVPGDNEDVPVEDTPDLGADSMSSAAGDEPAADGGTGEGSDDPVAKERDAYRETAQRLQADFENYRKRVIKQQADAAERASESLVVKLLTVLDTIELAQAHESNESVDQVANALLDVLNKEGLEKVRPVDEVFDPSVHEAVVHEPGEGEPTVTEVMRSGYVFKGRVVRPAMVKVVG